MSVWNNFRESVSRTTQRTAEKTKSIANIASLKAKVTNLEAAVAEEYEALGRFCYEQEVAKVDNAELIRGQVRIISDINKQLNAVNAEIREAKRAQAEAKAAAEAEKEARRAAKAEAKADSEVENAEETEAETEEAVIEA